jgi:hypothetical protein
MNRHFLVGGATGVVGVRRIPRTAQDSGEGERPAASRTNLNRPASPAPHGGSLSGSTRHNGGFGRDVGDLGADISQARDVASDASHQQCALQRRDDQFGKRFGVLIGDRPGVKEAGEARRPFGVDDVTRVSYGTSVGGGFQRYRGDRATVMELGPLGGVALSEDLGQSGRAVPLPLEERGRSFQNALPRVVGPGHVSILRRSVY